MEKIIDEVKKIFNENADETVRTGQQRFVKGGVNTYGVLNAQVTAIAKELFGKIKEEPKAVIFSYCEELWKSAYFEESIVACDWSYYIRERYTPDDFETLSRWLDTYVTNWAECDTLCNHTIGTFVEEYPEFAEKIKRWTSSSNRWMKRGAAVTFIIPARKGMFLRDIIQISDSLLEDSDDLVLKGCGWMLKAASEAHRKEIFEYVMSRKSIMPRTTLRYAIEKMPPEMRKAAMAK